MSKFEVGEICDVREQDGSNSYIECVIHEVNPEARYLIEQLGFDAGFSRDYSIIVDGRTSDRSDGSWLIGESCLRKKRPPQQLDDEAADQEFIDELSKMLNISTSEPATKELL